MNIRKNVISSLVVIIAFLLSLYLADFLDFIFGNWRQILPKHDFVRSILWFCMRLAPVFIVTPLLVKGNLLKALGLNQVFLKAFFFGMLFTLPLYLGFLIVFTYDKNLTLYDVWAGSIHAGFYEEIVMRSFLFGLLFRYFRWGFIPAALLTAIFFGAAHIYQGNDFISAFWAFLITAMGSVWFGWLYVEWRFNAAINISLHLFMNLSWFMFDVAGGAAGGLWSNIFRAITIAVSIIYTVRFFCKKEGFIVNKKIFWVN